MLIMFLVMLYDGKVESFVSLMNMFDLMVIVNLKEYEYVDFVDKNLVVCCFKKDVKDQMFGEFFECNIVKLICLVFGVEEEVYCCLVESQFCDDDDEQVQFNKGCLFKIIFEKVLFFSLMVCVSVVVNCLKCFESCKDYNSQSQINELELLLLVLNNIDVSQFSKYQLLFDII